MQGGSCQVHEEHSGQKCDEDHQLPDQLPNHGSSGLGGDGDHAGQESKTVCGRDDGQQRCRLLPARAKNASEAALLGE